MAEEIKLVGNFTDNITPKLRKLSKALDDVSKSFTKIQKKLRPITREMGNLAMASERVAKALKDQKTAIDMNARSWSNYKKEVGQAGAAQRKAFKGVPRGGTTAPRVPRQAQGMRGRGGAGIAAGVGGGVFGVTLSNTLTNAVVAGFRIGTNLMMKPFQMFGSAFAERVGDEMADIQSAGGMFAIDQKNKEGQRLFKSFSEARNMQEDLNRQLAKSAAALPGATNDYVRAARGLTDTVMQAFQSDRKGFKELAQSMGAAADASSQKQIAQVLSKFTEQTVLLGQGGSKSGMPLTVLMEQMITQDQVSVKGMKTRFRQLMYNPLLSGALEDAQEGINATVVGSAKRISAVMTALQKALPEEVITAQRMSMSGVIESIRSAILDPDTGIFGLGRELKLAIPKINDFGQFVDENGDVVESASEAVKENTTLFKIIRETLGGFLTPLASLVEFLPLLFDPLLGIGEAFVDLRKTSMMVLQKFNAYSNWFKEQKFPDAPQRGALAAFNKLLLSIGAIDKGEALSTAKMLETKGSDLASIFKKIFKQLFDSDFMNQIGETLGKAIGSAFSAMAKILGGAKDIASAGPFAQGFKTGFESVGGSAAIKSLIGNIFQLIGKGILEVFRAAPFEASLFAGIMLLGPAIAGALGTAIIGIIPKLFSGMMGGSAKSATKFIKPAASPFLSESGSRQARKIRVSGSRTARRASKAGKAFLSNAKQIKGVSSFAKAAKNMAKVAKPMTKFAKAIPGGAVAIGAIDAGLRIASGESAGRAIGGAVASTVGATMGGILGQAIIPIPGVGAALGSVAGGFLGDAIFSAIAGPTDEQKEAAAIQKQAALLQKQAATLNKSGIDTKGLQTLQFGDSQEFIKRLEVIGLRGKLIDQIGGEYQEYVTLVSDATKKAEELNSDIQRVRKLGITGPELAEQVRPLQEAYNTAAGKAEKSLTNLNTTWDKLAPETTKVILDSFKEMPVGSVADAIAQKIREIEVKAEVEAMSQMPMAPSPIMGFPVPGQQIFGRHKGHLDTPLGKAISEEMKNKPSGSDLMIANSSETVIPAYKGNGGGSIDYLKDLCAKVAEVQRMMTNSSAKMDSKMTEISTQMTSGVNVKIVGTPTVLAKLDISGAGGQGGPTVFGAAASAHGLAMTSGYRPGDDDSYHGIDRARDYAGDPANMKKFATFLAATYGGSLKELIYTPLGYSIKNGAVVPPYAQDTHYDHVHVAYGKGAGKPAFFSSQKEAINWEKKMAPSNSMIGSVTSNSAEMGQPVYNQSVTVNVSGAGMDNDQISNMVAGKVLTAMQQATFTELDVT